VPDKPTATNRLAEPTASVAWTRSWLQLARQKPQDPRSGNGSRFLLERHIQCKCDSDCNSYPMVPSPCPKGMSLPAWLVDRLGGEPGVFETRTVFPQR